MRHGKKVLIVISVVAAAFFLLEKTEKKYWLGFYYPGNCLDCINSEIISPNLNTEFDCISWGYGIRKARNDTTNFETFECGYSCEHNSDINLYICDITKDY